VYGRFSQESVYSGAWRRLCVGLKLVPSTRPGFMAAADLLGKGTKISKLLRFGFFVGIASY